MRADERRVAPQTRGKPLKTEERVFTVASRKKACILM